MIVSKDFSRIKKNEYVAYERIRIGGRFNMITQARDAASAARLDLSTYMGVMKNYEALMAKWPDVRK